MNDDQADKLSEGAQPPSFCPAGRDRPEVEFSPEKSASPSGLRAGGRFCPQAGDATPGF